MQTHDLIGRMLIAENFKKKRCKVFFSADGCDELLGGQQLYFKIFKKDYDLTKNISPYSSIIDLGIKFKGFAIDNYKSQIDIKWKLINDRYSFLPPKERNIQSSFFMDYFVQSTNVANRSNDLISCNYSVEPRNVFIQKRILKILLNLPLKYKIDFNSTNKSFTQKPILKNIFLKYYSKNLIFSKTGFPGYPNHLKKIKDFNNSFPLIKKFLGIIAVSKTDKSYYDKKKYKRDLEWKKINTEIFLEQFNS
jgi:asparagine synthetase B (glutamine-hydrolysing)